MLDLPAHLAGRGWSAASGWNPRSELGVHGSVTSIEAAVTDPDTAGPEPASAPGFEALYAAHWAPLVRLGQLVTGSRAVGEELAQEAFLGLLRQGGAVEHPRAYLRRSVVNAAVRARQRVQRELDHHAAHPPAEATLPPEVDETWRHLARLPPRQRAVLALRYYEDLSEADIATVLGCRPGTVKSLAARGLDRLRKDLT